MRGRVDYILDAMEEAWNELRWGEHAEHHGRDPEHERGQVFSFVAHCMAGAGLISTQDFLDLERKIGLRWKTYRQMKEEMKELTK